MKQISCEFADQDLAEQAVHSLRQHGYAIKEESLEAKEYQAKTPPVAMAGQLMTFLSSRYLMVLSFCTLKIRRNLMHWAVRFAYPVRTIRPVGSTAGY